MDMNRLVLIMTMALAVSANAVAKPVELTLGNGDVLRVEAVTPAIFRIRLSADGKFAPSLLERYGIVRTDWPALEPMVQEQGGVTRISTDAGALAIRLEDGRMQLFDSADKAICEQILRTEDALDGA